MFQVIRQEQLFLGAWNYESQTQQLVVWPRTVAHSRVSDWAIMGEWPVLHQENFENVKYFQCNKHTVFDLISGLSAYVFFFFFFLSTLRLSRVQNATSEDRCM